ncbi:cadherin-like beta sandwich domain-containing protein [bacterium AH-315-J21]|nr:cadherin-like beta sandwich domain-containing protein [bacterium AH-315-J21]
MKLKSVSSRRALLMIVLCLGAITQIACSDTNGFIASGPKIGEDATLVSLSTSISGFPVPFIAETFSYAVTVGLGTDSVLITPQAADTLASVVMHDPNFVGQRFKVDNASSYGPASLIVGGNIFVVEVVSADGQQMELYTLNIQRLPQNSLPL